MSEWALIIKVWTNAFETLFEGEGGVSLVRGDTQNGKYKVDLRICLKFQQKCYDIANVELKKDENNAIAAKEDETKTIVEGKTILSSLCPHHNASFLKYQSGHWPVLWYVYCLVNSRKKNYSWIFV